MERELVVARSSLAVLCVALLAAVACSELLEFADWVVPVPDGARVVEYAAATDEERAGKWIEVEPELIISPRGDDPNYAFYRPSAIGVDDDGNIYVADSSNARVQVFDADGEYLRTLGRAGQGPGEFSSLSGGWVGGPAGIAITGDRVIVYDQIASKLAIWNLAGDYETDVILSRVRPSLRITGTPEGTFVGELSDRHDDGTRTVRTVRFSATGEPLLTYAGLPSPGNFQVGTIGLAPLTGRPIYTVSSPGDVYVSPAEEYQVLAFDAGGEARWALRVAWEREPVTEEHRNRILGPLTEQFADLDTTETVWPTHFAAISRLMVDGHGHVYVLPYVLEFDGSVDERPVDVYSRAGELLFSGYMPNVSWVTSLGDQVFGIRANEESGEREPVRYRLIEPFE